MAYPRIPPSATFRPFRDSYSDIASLQADLRRGGLESSSLIVAVDFTRSNEWSGARSFGGRSLHHLADNAPNPYEQALGIIGATLAPFDDDGLIPAYGFGCTRTGDHAVFSFLPADAPVDGLANVLTRYRALVPHVRLAGPTSFAPAIRRACEIVVDSGNAYHILLIIADGQVTRSLDLPDGQHSPQERETIDAIVAASSLPLSIVIVGVGDGPWDVMRTFDDALPTRRFDNLQFVALDETLIAARASMPAASAGDAVARLAHVDAHFALHALMEVPEQYAAIVNAGLLGPRAEPPSLGRRMLVLDPPAGAMSALRDASSLVSGASSLASSLLRSAFSVCCNTRATPQRRSAAPTIVPPSADARAAAVRAVAAEEARRRHATTTTVRPPPAHNPLPSAPSVGGTDSFAPSAPAPAADHVTCGVCLDATKDTAFDPCGHLACASCASQLSVCPICRRNVVSLRRVYL